MRSLRWSVLALALAVAAPSCGGGGGGGGAAQPAALSSRWAAPSILSHIPADSPYVMVTLDPPSEALRQKLMQNVEQQIAQSTAAIDKLHGVDRSKLKPWHRALLAFLDELRGKSSATWIEQLGFDPRGRFALYGLSLWPVARIEIASPQRMQAAIQRVLIASGVAPELRTLDGRRYWLTGDSELSLVFAVLDREAVAALLPTAVLDAALPLVLGTRLPEHNLAAATTVPELLARHHLLGFLLAYVDSHNLADIIAGPQPRALDIPLRARTGAVPPACRTDLDRLASLVPRVVLGYHKVDATAFEATAVVELAPGAIGGLRALHAAVPEVGPRAPGHPLLALGAAVDLDQLIAWLRRGTQELHDHPFTCPWFAGINQSGAELADALATPLPPAWRGVRGFALTIDDASLVPPSVTGHVILAGDRVADLVTSLAGSVPAIAGIPLVGDGRAVALPTQQLRLPVQSAHLALTTDRLVIAAGAGSERRATEHLASRAPKASPLLTMAFDMPRLNQLLVALGQPQPGGFGTLRDVGLRLDIGDRGLSFDVWGTWGTAPPAQLAAPPHP